MHQALIVDDERSVVDALEISVPWQELGIAELFKAVSARHAIEILDRNSIALLVTDIRMPGMNGIELIEYAKKRNDRIKCILLTGHSDFEYAQRAIGLGANDYLLKPVSDEDLLLSCRKAIAAYDEEWKEIVSVRKAKELFQENLPTIRSRFLMDILAEQIPHFSELETRLADFEIDLREGDRVAVMVIRVEDGFPEFARSDSSMVEYSVLRIVDELFKDGSAAWRCKDASNYLVLTIKETARVPMEALGLQLQKNVKQYLKGNISIVVSDWGVFPRDLPRLYSLSIAAMHRTIGSDNKFFLSLRAIEHPFPAHSLIALYAPPDLFRLMETGRWEDAEKKVDAIFGELTEKWPNSQEHATEAIALILNALSRIAHSGGVLLADILPKTGAAPFDIRTLNTIQRMKDWAASAIEATRGALERELKDTRSALVKKVSSYIDENLHRDVSLQSIADFLDLHPAYVSRIYKLETGENLSAYILKRRMERAAYLLRSTDLKILEISTEIGYPNPAYFIKVFKTVFGMTPVEYRSADQLRPETE